MSGIWQERAVKKPEDFHAALWAGSCGITEDFALDAFKAEWLSADRIGGDEG